VNYGTLYASITPPGSVELVSAAYGIA
jgi:hypothetical protein